MQKIEPKKNLTPPYKNYAKEKKIAQINSKKKHIILPHKKFAKKKKIAQNRVKKAHNTSLQKLW